MRLQRLLLNSPALTNSPGVGITTLVFIVKMLLGIKGCSLLTSPKFLTVSALEFTIASVSVNSVFKDLSFKPLPSVTNKKIKTFQAE